MTLVTRKCEKSPYRSNKKKSMLACVSVCPFRVDLYGDFLRSAVVRIQTSLERFGLLRLFGTTR